MACTVRVPCEVIKQRAQAMPGVTTRSVFWRTIQKESFAGLYRGYLSTVLREIPFSLIQFPLWEFLKSKWNSEKMGPGTHSAICGFVAGGTAAGITTPMDVAKTRIMLAESGTRLASGNIYYAMKTVFQSSGIQGLFRGVVPRMIHISFGGAIFLGVYDKAKSLMNFL